MFCAKCRQLKPHGNDTWCLSCSAWEQLGHEISAAWSNPALRSVAGEAVIATTQQVRALRSFALSLKSAGDSRAAHSAASGKGSARPGVARSSVPPARELPPPPPAPPRSVKEEDAHEDEEDLESETAESGESEAPLGVTAKADPARRPPEPKEPPRNHRSPPRERRDREDTERPDRERSERGTKKKEKKKNRGDRGRRGGRRHCGLYRQLEDPDIRVRQRPPAGFWDTPREEDRRRPLERSR